MGRVTRSEWRWVAAFTTLVLALSLLPYVLAYSAQGGAWRFSGFLLAVEDGNSYIAKMRLGSDGAWLYRLAYTTEPQSGALIYLPYLLLGKLAARPALHEQLVALYHLARLAASIALIAATYLFLARFITSIRLRRWGFVLAVLGGGLGWLALAIGGGNGPMPLEYYSPESFGFLALFALPHLAAARALLLLALLAYINGASGADARGGWKAGLALAALWFFQPLNVPLAWGLMALAWGLTTARALASRRRPAPSEGSTAILARDASGRALRMVAQAIIVPAPLLVYSVIAFSTNPALRQWTAQNILPSPTAVEYLLGYGLLAPFALVGLVRAARSHEIGANLLIAWVIAMPLLVSLPVNLQRRLAEGVWVALVVLAMSAFAAWEEAHGLRKANFGSALLTALALPSTVLLYGSAMRAAVRPAEPVFIPAAEARAFEWLDAHATPASIVLTDFATGNALPAYAQVVPYVGHGPETLYLAAKRPQVERFFSANASRSARVTLLATSGADYVILGPADALAAAPGVLLTVPGIESRFAADGWQVFEVVLVLPP
jgi:uncharacterized membrane protein YvlD (DUF360 family)